MSNHWRSRERIVFNRSASWWAQELLTIAVLILWVSVMVEIAVRIAP